MKNQIPQSKEALMSEMKKLSARIGMMEIQRATGQYISIIEVDKVKNEFKRLSQIYKNKYYRI